MPPAFLDGAPQAVLGKLDPGRALMAVLNARNEPASLGCLIAFGNIDSALAAAKVQQRRIARARTSSGKSRPLDEAVATYFMMFTST